MTKRSKLQKPTPDFPLTPRGDNRWQIKRKGKVWYFTGDAETALQKWNEVKDDIEAGRMPTTDDDDEDEKDVTVEYLCKAFCSSKLDLVDSGELAPNTYYAYKLTCQRIIDAFGKRTRVSTLKGAHFQTLRRRLSKGRSVVTLAGEITRAKMVFKYAYDFELIDKPLRGVKAGLGVVSKKSLRVRKAKQEPKLFTADEVQRILEAVENDPRMTAVVLLSANCGFGPRDLMDLQPRHVKDGFINLPRGKTGIMRRIPLWPETLDAIDKVGLPLRMATTSQALSVQFRALLNKVGITRRAGIYWLRHNFETYGGEARDQIALDRIMGHCDQSMASTYRESVSDDRLRRVVDAVHDWLFVESGIDKHSQTLRIANVG